MSDSVLHNQLVAMNQPSIKEEDQKAHESWCSNRTVDVSYLRFVLGNPEEVTVIPPVPPIRILTKEQIRDMICPFPPEAGYD